LKITTEPLENCQLRLSIELDEERTQQAMRRAARQIARQVNIPGFRKGKAPYSLIVQRFGEDTIRQEAAELMAEEAYGEALEQEEIVPYAPAALEDVELEPIGYKFTVSLPPTVELGDYRAFRLKPKKVRVYKKDVQQALEGIREENAILEPVERPAALGDGVSFGLVGLTAEGEEVFKGDDVHIMLEAESTNPAPGFAEAVVGMEAGEERSFTLALGDDFPRQEFRGQAVDFTVKLVDVYQSILPALDDDLARTVGKFDSLKELEEHIREQLRQAAQRQSDAEYEAQVMETILEQAEVEYPPVMLEEELGSVVGEVEQAIKRDFKLSLEDYLHVRSMSMEELREELEPRAVAHLKRALVLGEVVRQEGLDVDGEEIGAHIEKMSAPWGARAEEVRSSLSSDRGQRAVRSRLLADKAVQRLLAIARGEAPEPTSADEVEGQAGEEAGSEEQ